MNMTRAVDASIHAVSPVLIPCGTGYLLRDRACGGVCPNEVSPPLPPCFGGVKSALRRGRGAFGGRPEQALSVELLLAVLGGRPAPDPEQALAPHQPHQDREVHDHRRDPQDRDPLV